LPVTKEGTIAHYATRLAQGLGDAFDAAWWQPQLDLALLGGFRRFGYWLGWLAASRSRRSKPPRAARFPSA
jgi:hypothetical protein